MRVVLLGDMTGTRNGQEWPPRGSEVELPDDEALALVRGFMARPVVTASADIERAVIPDADTERRTLRANARR